MNPKTPMQLDKNISVGNLVSWGLILIGTAFAYSKLDSATLQNTKDVEQAKSAAIRVEGKLEAVETNRSMQIQKIMIDVAVMQKDLSIIDKKLDDARENYIKRLADNQKTN